MQPGDLYWIDYPPANGREQSGRRPGIVLQDDTAAGTSPLVLTIPLTTTAGLGGYLPAVADVPADAQNGLSADSYALLFQLRATDRRRFRGRIGTVSAAVLAQVYQALDLLTGHP